MSSNKFTSLPLSERVLRAVADAGYTTPTPIQEQAIPFILMGRDILGCAQTGTGKTACFCLPMIDILSSGCAKARMPRSLILEPTRELAAQVAENFDLYGKHSQLTTALLIGGESMTDQLKILERGADVLIATPGRLLDVFDRGRLLLKDVRILIIDEADRMLDMGFIPEVERIVSVVSNNRQTLLFSATMPPPIQKLADAFLTNPKRISIAPPSTPAATVDQGVVVISGKQGASAAQHKRSTLRALIRAEDPRQALIFCNRKRDIGVLHRSLVRHGFSAAYLHGDLAQSARTEVLERFRQATIKLLVCSDVAARGLHIDDLSHVFNFDVPINPEDYVHRIGRTGRAGRSGRAITIALPEDRRALAAIEALIGTKISRIELPDQESGESSVAMEEEEVATEKRDRHSARARKSARGDRSTKSRKSSKTPFGDAASSRSKSDADASSGRKSDADASSGRKPSADSPRKSRREKEVADTAIDNQLPAFLLREPVSRSKARS